MIIKTADIAHICKMSVNGALEYPQMDESLDREDFTNMIVGLGHHKEKAETIYGSMRELIALYNVHLPQYWLASFENLNWIQKWEARMN